MNNPNRADYSRGARMDRAGALLPRAQP